MTGFFDFLPSDLHICILQTWIGCDHSDSAGSDGQLLRALSALDIACCSAKHRKPCWLELTASLRFRGMVPIKRDTESYMLWLTSRSIPVSCLVINAQGNLTVDRRPSSLPTVSELRVLHLPQNHALNHVLACCPNLTSIHSFSGLPFWRALEARPPMNLTALAGASPEYSQAALLIHGRHLIKLELELRVQNTKPRSWRAAEIVGILPQACPVLESLSLLDCQIALAALLVMLRACRHLTELVLDTERVIEVMTSSDLAAAAAAILEVSKLRRFTIVVRDLVFDAAQEQTFTQLLTTHPELDYLKFQYCCSYRTTGYLSCSWQSEDAEERILSSCMVVNPLRQLSLCVSVSPHLLVSLLSRCLALASLEVSYVQHPNNTRLLCSTIAAHFGQLRSLVLDIGCYPLDGDVISLLKGLPWLKELKVRHGNSITSRTLQAIVDNKHRLESYCCGEGFQSAEVAKFRRLAKEAGLLPVPWIGPFK